MTEPASNPATLPGLSNTLTLIEPVPSSIISSPPSTSLETTVPTMLTLATARPRIST
ncbi:hypothetical protein HY640_01050 [Candidatus Woesearchaeota archaeon]|nr:hypothetical protein [Candidatus Woesearchaeota archaeon]